MKPEWKVTYTVPIGNKVWEIDAPTGHKRLIEERPLLPRLERTVDDEGIHYKSKKES